MALDSEGGPKTNFNHSADEERNSVPRPPQDPCDGTETTDEARPVQIRFVAEYLAHLSFHDKLLRSSRLRAPRVAVSGNTTTGVASGVDGPSKRPEDMIARERVGALG